MAQSLAQDGFHLIVSIPQRTRIIFFGERHLRTVIDEYMEHYHLKRNHHELENRLVSPSQAVGVLLGTVERRERLGDILNYYHRGAA